MASFNELVGKQKQIGERIEAIVRNFKKDPASRKASGSYFQERLKRLEDEWSQFEIIDTQIRTLENPPLDHNYFADDYYNAIMDVVHQYKEIFETSLLRVLPIATKNQNTIQQTENSQAGIKKTPSDETTRLIRRQAAMMASLERLLKDDVTSENIDIASRLWHNIEGLHFQLAESCEEPEEYGYNITRYIQLEKNTWKILNAAKGNSSAQHNSSPSSSQPESYPMPKITVPKFDGNYLKWPEFHDLFSSLIISQPLPKLQKIWYLKTHLMGEAANLIKHFAATGENFDAAWAIVADRYNNKRLLVNKLVQEMIAAPRKTRDNYKTLHDKTQECLLALQNLQINTSSWDPLLLHFLLKRLDPATRLRYEQSLLHPREVPTIKDFLEFLERHFQSMEALVGKEKSSESRAKVCTSITKLHCVLCRNGNHPLFTCRGFLQLSPPSRLQFIQKQKYCVNCLKPGHSAKNCTLRSCMKCNKKHNTLLHLEIQSPKGQTSAPSVGSNYRNYQDSALVTKTEKISQEAASLTTAKISARNGYVLLSTAIINVRAKERVLQCRALLDSGSQLNIVSERLIKRLGVLPKPTAINITGIGSTNTKVQRRVNIELHSRINNFSTRLEAAVLPQIISPQPSQSINIEEWPIPKTIVLADPNFNLPDKIDVLLGAEFYHQLLITGQITLGEDLPTLQNTVFGWVISGKVGGNQSPISACGMCTEDTTNLEGAIAQLWELENIKPDKCLSVSERQCEDHFAQTHKMDEDGRFIVRIPFCDNPNALGDSHGIAFNRFLSLENRLAKNPEIKLQYVRFMEEYEALGHMTQIDTNSMIKPNYFIPHHCILKPESSTTKLRVVFDASTKTSSGLSLNDLMHTGPTVQSELFSILLRFRLPRFVFTTDIQKMYRQVLLHPEDRRYQIIIWRKDQTAPITYYQLNTVTYGTRSAPYLATKCLEKIAKDNMARYPYASQFLLDNFYVDDGIGGDDNLNTALTIQRELQHILKQHGLHLQKWSANHQQLLQNISETEQEVNFDFNNENSTSVKTLGLTWMPRTDKFCVKVSLGDINHITKRTVSSDLARLFDPLGILAPIVVTAKIIIQELWQIKLTWDEALPAELQKRWMTFRNELEHVNNMKISRHIYEGHITSKIQIHAFADASEKAYGAAIYIRSVIKDGQVIVRLLCAKSRVAPLKRQTLPRLELCAALLSTQLTARVKKDLKLENTPTYFWTDSEIVLAWINSPSASYQTFVANRISTIQELSLAEQWRHVSSKDNPADLISRGLSPKKFTKCTLWFFGPIFLHGREEIWPQKYSKVQVINYNDSEMERKKVAAITTSSEDSASIIYKIQHNGSFRTLQRVVGYVIRFINNTRKLNQQRNLALTVPELENALIVIVRALQQTDFEEDLRHLKRYNEVSKSSPCSNLTPFLDINGIIRVGGRLKSSILPYDARHPMLIPHNDPITKLLMRTIHEQNRHCGPQALLAHTRQKYWPMKGKSAARSIVQHCVRCAKAKPQLFTQIMGNLPSTRVTPARPFINSGVDFCGPFWVHYKVRGKKPQKAYIAVFCCFATKAVHLELVSDLTTEAFIGALKRFVSRRGHCQNLYCDNATNFVGTKNQLKELSEVIYASSAQGAINKECISKGITFHFIPPRAPHFGGLWEAAVKSAKHLLVRSVSTASLTYEELDTVVIEIEGILNSRPISPMSNNPNDLAALTPGHFLIGEPLNAQLDIRSTQTRLNLLTRWKLVSHLKEEFWRRWSREYLCELQYRHKWKSQKANVRPGEMVIVKEDNTTPLQWPLGRVVKVYQGDDGFVRVADVKTSSGITRRPIDRLAPLPVNDMEADEASYQKDPDTATIHEDGEPEVSRKKRRMSVNANIVAVMIALMLMPLAIATPVHNTQFDKQLGIHFEGIGSAAVSSTEWQLLIYYDLAEFWSESALFLQGTKTLHRLCGDMREKATCTNLVKYFEHTEAELTMDSTLLSGRIHKRAAIDLVGNIAHSLFGVLDSKYAEDMAQTISQVKENEAHLLNLLKNQTSIIDSTINILKSDQEKVKKKFDQIDSQLSEIYNKVRNDGEEHYQEKVYRMFSSLCIQLIITAANLQRTQSAIFDILTNTHRGIISPLLLTPTQLQHEVEKIRFHLPESLELPVRQEDSLQLYKFMKVKGGLSKNTVIFSVTIPLIEHEEFEIFYLTPIPNWVNNILVSIKPCSSLLAINTVRNQYFTMSNAEFNLCLLIKDNRYLCSKNQVRYQRGSATCACEINLFYNKTKSDCPVQQIKDTSTWIPLRQRNKWMYSIPSPAQVTAVCNREITQIPLEGSGLLSLEPECTLKHEFMVLDGQQVISSDLKTSYTSLWEITEQSHTKHLAPLLNEIKIKEYIPPIQNLTNLQTSLATQEILQLPNQIKTHNYHHMTVGYSALIITGCILIYLIFKRKSNPPPIPAPRTQNTTSDFTVHI